MSGDTSFVRLTLPAAASRVEHQDFTRLCTLLAYAQFDPDVPLDHESCFAAAGLKDNYNRPMLAAAAHVIIDLVDQGWLIQVDEEVPLLRAPGVQTDRASEKARIRRQELLRRDSQLRQPSVRRFVSAMERSHQYRGALVSVFDLMRDGCELADALADVPGGRGVIQPYVQVVDSATTCELTGFKLHDIWRYFRHTWSNAYSTVPGRSMPILIRDAATRHHAVIGIAAISSAVVQIAERDSWMGWDTKQFVQTIEAQPTPEVAQWLARRIKSQLEEIYVDDLLRDGVLQPGDLKKPSSDVATRLKEDAERHRAKHHRAGGAHEVRNVEKGGWVELAETHLYRSKRAALLAETLEIKALLGRYLGTAGTLDGLKSALADPKAKAQIGRLARRARGERVGTVIADLTVCGAIAPYSALAAGKLVAALAVSPPVLAAYRTKYGRPSEIASGMAGRPITREARLSFVGTTSLYGTGSSQYNRLFWPAEIMGGTADSRMGFHELGRSKAFGTSHFSDETVDALVRLCEQGGSLVRVNGLFGEGVSPRLRKVRMGLGALGWPANELLRHGRERILYGVPLVANVRDFSLGVDEEPNYLVNPEPADNGEAVANWWFERWALRRAAQEHVQSLMRVNRLVRPVRHNARVLMPTEEDVLQIALPQASDLDS